MDDLKVSEKVKPVEVSKFDRTVELHNSIRVAEGKSALSQEEFASAILAGLQKRPHWVRILLRNVALLMAVLFLAGCSILPLKPGSASIESDSDGRKVIQVHQSQNPKNDTVQDYKRVVDSNGVTTEEVHTKIGAAQKDLAREMTAKLGSLRPVMWVGIFVLLFGIGSFHPYLRAIVGSVTTSVIIVVAGLGMIVLPSLIVGNEILILGVGVGAVVLYWFSHRHGKLQGLVDANKNGVDDREEKL